MAERLMGWVSNTQEPKRLNRYELIIDDSLRLTCKSISMPKINLEKTEIHRMHNLYKVSGSKITYDDITCAFYDFVDNGAAQYIDNWHTQIYDIGTSLMGFPSTYKKNLTVVVYAPDHSIVETWTLVGAWPMTISRKDLSWEDGNGHQEITITLAIDEAQIIVS